MHLDGQDSVVFQVKAERLGLVERLVILGRAVDLGGAERLVIRLLVVRLEPAVRLVILRSLGQVDILASLEPVASAVFLGLAELLDNQDRAASLDRLGSVARADGLDQAESLDPVVRLVTQRSVELVVLQEQVEHQATRPLAGSADKVVRLDIQVSVASLERVV